ncbi:hypothetical protein GCK32_000422 [Trichostrongylus colubriformis]|uniref:Uncharacterized protein n=1 Tax=Trichostrongylus colubriformis TaxID=6319 RepID=A0AAN8FEB0_TRICO
MFFNCICIGTIVIDNLDVTILVKNIANILFSYSSLMYGFVMPLVMLYHNEFWQTELKRIIGKARHNRVNDDPTVHIKSTLGEEIMVDSIEHSERYFEMLRKDWSYS